MRKLYKYHVRLFRLYEVFGEKIFYGRQADEALRASPYVYHSTLTLTGLDKRKLIMTPRRTEIREVIKDADFRKHYRRLSKEGLKMARHIEQNRGLLTMFLLRQ